LHGLPRLKATYIRFAVHAAKLIEQLPDTLINRTYFSQIVRSLSSVGANYRPQRAKSNNDFINKLKIVEECDETIYFLQLIAAINEKHKHLLQPLVDEGKRY